MRELTQGPPHQRELAGGVANLKAQADMTERTCAADGCDNPPIARGFCRLDYHRERAAGRLPVLVRPTPVERFWSHVEKTSTCWLWTGATTAGGYGQHGVNGAVLYAHRVSYEMHIGPIPEGLHIDHLCRVRRCVNPMHLEAVTQAENTRRGMGSQVLSRRRGLCLRQHRMTPENTIIRRATATRSEEHWCRECAQRRERERTVRRRERRAP